MERLKEQGKEKFKKMLMCNEEGCNSITSSRNGKKSEIKNIQQGKWKKIGTQM